MVNAQDIADIQDSRWASPSLLSRKAAGMLVTAMLVASVLMAIMVFASGSLPAMLGFKTMVVTSGSMEPAIHVGDAVILRPTPPESVSWQFKDGFIRTGDVVTFTPLSLSQKDVRWQAYSDTEYYADDGVRDSCQWPQLTRHDKVPDRQVEG